MREVGRRICSIIIAALVVAACGANGSLVSSATPTAAAATTATTSATSSSATPTASKGPATAQFMLTGTAGLSGPVTAQTIICGRPSLGGPEIFFIGQSGTTGPAVVIFLRAGYVEVRVATGSAATLRERYFTGTGITGFDAASGAALDSTLTETTAAGSAIGNLGAVTSISGTIDCGDQQPGTANVVVTGPTPFGQLAGALTGVEVECTPVGPDDYVGVVGLSMAGTTPVLMFVTASSAMIQVTVETGSAASGYTGKGAGLVTLVPGGAHMTGDVTLQVAAGATPSPDMLHVTGDATCGTTAQQ